MSALLRESRAAGARDLRVAVDEYEIACSKGEVSGCVNGARLQLEGLGTYRDEVAATKALDAACAGGTGIACAHLASAAAKRVDRDRARSLAERACASGFRPSCAAVNEGDVPLTMLPKDRSGVAAAGR